MRALRRSYAPFLPFVLVIVATWVGGGINSVDAHGRVVDDTDEPVAR